MIDFTAFSEELSSIFEKTAARNFHLHNATMKRIKNQYGLDSWIRPNSSSGAKRVRKGAFTKNPRKPVRPYNEPHPGYKGNAFGL